MVAISVMITPYFKALLLLLRIVDTTLARSARTRTPRLRRHVVLPESDGPIPFSILRDAGGGRLPKGLEVGGRARRQATPA